MSQDHGIGMDFLGVEKGSTKNESQTNENLATTQAKQELVATEQIRSLAASGPSEGNTIIFRRLLACLVNILMRKETKTLP
jgi:hypothetical protein